jgi:predicted small secreted protein
MIRKLAVIIMLVACAAIASGCNTMHGLGKDIESLGKGIKHTSEKK